MIILMRYTLLLAFTLFLAPAQMLADSADGFVTKIYSPTIFNLGALHVTLDTDTKCAVRITGATDSPFNSWKPSDSWKWADSSEWIHSRRWMDPGKWSIPRDFVFSTSSRQIPMTTTPCSELNVMIGSAVHVIGTRQPNTQSFMAKSAVLNVPPRSAEHRGAALIEEASEKPKKRRDMEVQVWLDG